MFYNQNKVFVSFATDRRGISGSIALIQPQVEQGGKSGQQRAPYFLTGRQETGDGLLTASAAENIPLRAERSKGEMVE